MNEYVVSFLELLKSKKEVSAILLLGGMGNQCNIHPLDKYSDVDISIVIENGEMPDWLPDFSFYLWGNGAVTDILVNVYQCTQEMLLDDDILWDMGKCEAYNYAKIYYDKNGDVDRIIKNKIAQSDKRKERLIGNIHKIDRFIHKNPAKMIFRGQLLAAHLIINEAVKMYIESLFLVNGKYVPHLKWQENDLKYLEWLPSECIHKLKEIMTIREFAEDDIYRRVKTFDELYFELKELYHHRYSDDIYDVVCSSINKDRQLLRETAASYFVANRKDNDGGVYKSYINSNLLGLDDLSVLQIVNL